MRENDLTYPVIELVELEDGTYVKTTIDASTIVFKKLDAEPKVIRRGRRAKQPIDESQSGDGRDGLSSV